MTRYRETNAISRWWNIVIEASSAAVAIHYAAPWNEKADSRG